MVYTATVNDQLFFSSNNTDISQGISAAKVKQEINKASAFDFTILPVSSFYNSFERYKSIITVKRDNAIIFRGRVTDIDDSSNFQRSVKCEGSLAYLLDSQISPDRLVTITPAQITTYTNAAYKTDNYTIDESFQYEEPEKRTSSPKRETARAHLNAILAIHNSQVEQEKRFLVGTITVTDIDTTENYSEASYRDARSAIDGDLIAFHGGYLTVSYDANGNQYLNWLKEASSTSAQMIKIGENLISFDKKLNIDELFTVLIPIGKDDLTIASVNNNSIMLEIQSGIDRFGRIIKVVDFSDIDTAAELKSYGQKYIERFYKPDKVQFTIKAVDLSAVSSSHQAIEVGTNLTIQSSAHGLNNAYLCLDIENDLLGPQNDTYTIGDPEETLTELYNRNKRESDSATSSAISTAGIAGSNASSSHHACTFNKEGFSKQVYDDFTLKAKTWDIEADVINIKADLIDIDADLIDINDGLVTINNEIVSIKSLYAEKADVGELAADYFESGSLTTGAITCTTLYASDGIGSDSVVADHIGTEGLSLESHSHTISFSGGVVTIGGPQDSQGSFNVAATTWYQQQIAAAKLEAWNMAAGICKPNANGTATFPRSGTYGATITQKPVLENDGYVASEGRHGSAFQAYQMVTGPGGTPTYNFAGNAYLVSTYYYKASVEGTPKVTGWTAV